MDNNNQTKLVGTPGNEKEVIKPSVDAIAEFQVVTNGYARRIWRSSSREASVSTQSRGSTSFTGRLMLLLCNHVIDAKTPFATAKPPYKRNDYGVSAGAPITRNKLFILAISKSSASAEYDRGRYCSHSCRAAGHISGYHL